MIKLSWFLGRRGERDGADGGVLCLRLLGASSLDTAKTANTLTQRRCPSILNRFPLYIFNPVYALTVFKQMTRYSSINILLRSDLYSIHYNHTVNQAGRKRWQCLHPTKTIFFLFSFFCLYKEPNSIEPYHMSHLMSHCMNHMM